MVEILGANLGETPEALLHASVRGVPCAGLHWEFPTKATWALIDVAALAAEVTTDCIVVADASGRAGAHPRSAPARPRWWRSC